MKVFIDSNVPMYVAGREHPNREPARRLLAQVHSGEFEGYTSAEVLQEILFRYHGMGRAEVAGQVYDLFLELCPSVLPVSLADLDRAREVLATTAGVSVRDAVHAGVMLNHGLSHIATFDTGFDRIGGIERLRLV